MLQEKTKTLPDLELELVKICLSLENKTLFWKGGQDV